MSIARIESFIVQDRLETPFYFSQWDYDTRSVCLVKITTDDGTYGWGEGYGPAPVVKAGVDMLAPRLLGKNPLYTEPIWQDLHLRTLDYARSGAMNASISALDVALWDLKGKLLGQPVATLLGGPRRTKVRVYATGMYFSRCDDLPKMLADEARTYAEQGFQAMKMKVGLNLTTDVANVRAVREAIGPNIKLMVDANHAYSLREARDLAEALARFNIAWFEEPISPDDYDGYAELRRVSPIPIAAGECEYLVEGFRRLFEKGCVDVAQPDICASGGLTEAKRIATLARAFNTDLTPHSWGTGIAFAAAVHFTSTLDAWPGRMYAPEPYLEMDRSENPLRDKLTIPIFTPEAGAVAVPTAPGLGIDVDEAQLERFRIKQEGIGQ